MTEFSRTPDSNFDSLIDYDFEPHYHQWADLFPQASFYSILAAGHFLQNTHGREIAERILA